MRWMYQVELYHHSKDVPATVTKLLATIDRGSGNVLKKNPRCVWRGSSVDWG